MLFQTVLSCSCHPVTSYVLLVIFSVSVSPPARLSAIVLVVGSLYPLESRSIGNCVGAGLFRSSLVAVSLHFYKTALFLEFENH